MEQIKVRYNIDAQHQSTAYLNRQLSDGSLVGVNKHSELPVHVEWSDIADEWVLVCKREFDILNAYLDTWVEREPRPDCICKDEEVSNGTKAPPG